MIKTYFLVLLTFISIPVFTQTYNPGRKCTFEPNSWGDNLFLGVGGGGSVYFGPEDQHAGFTDRITFNPGFYIGKWINPYLGVRLVFQGGKIHTFEGFKAQKMYSMTHLNAHMDMMFNATNYFCNYDTKRFYHFIATAGLGYDKRDKNGALLKRQGFHGPTINAGIINTFRLTDKLSLFLEVGGAFIESGFDKGNKGGKPWNGMLNANAGLVLNFGKKTSFKERVIFTCEHPSGLTLNEQINILRAENEGLRKRPKYCPRLTIPECPVIALFPIITPNIIPTAVTFPVNSAVIEKDQEIILHNIGTYLKGKPHERVRIIGFADKESGSDIYNMKLSEKRAIHVANLLIHKFQINENRIKIEWEGSSQQPYKEKSWNRVVLIFYEE